MPLEHSPVTEHLIAYLRADRERRSQRGRQLRAARAAGTGGARPAPFRPLRRLLVRLRGTEPGRGGTPRPGAHRPSRSGEDRGAGAQPSPGRRFESRLPTAARRPSCL